MKKATLFIFFQVIFLALISPTFASSNSDHGKVLGTWSFGQSQNRNLLVEGWSAPEPNQIWTIGNKAIVKLPMPSGPARDLDLVIDANAFLTPQHKSLEIFLTIGGNSMYPINYNQPSNLIQSLHIQKYYAFQNPNFMTIQFDLKDGMSKQALGVGEKGLGLKSLRLEEHVPYGGAAAAPPAQQPTAVAPPPAPAQAKVPVQYVPDWFNPAIYIALNPDLKDYISKNPAAVYAEGGADKWAIKHFLSHGKNENRPARFDASIYVALNPDLLTYIDNHPDEIRKLLRGADEWARNHFINSGKAENRQFQINESMSKALPSIVYNYGKGANGVGQLGTGWGRQDAISTLYDPTKGNEAIVNMPLPPFPKQYLEMTIQSNYLPRHYQLFLNNQPLMGYIHRYLNGTTTQDSFIIPDFIAYKNPSMQLKFVFDPAVAPVKDYALESIAIEPYVAEGSIKDLAPLIKGDPNLPWNNILRVLQNPDQYINERLQNLQNKKNDESVPRNERTELMRKFVEVEKVRQGFTMLKQIPIIMDNAHRLGAAPAAAVAPRAPAAGLPADFDPAAYIRLSPDLQTYVAEHPADIAAAGGANQWAMDHYISNGRAEGRMYKEQGGAAAAPAPAVAGLPADFDPAAYIRLSPDLQTYVAEHPADIAAAGGANQWAMNHYISNGRAEGRMYKEQGGAAAAPSAPASIGNRTLSVRGRETTIAQLNSSGQTTFKFYDVTDEQMSLIGELTNTTFLGLHEPKFTVASLQNLNKLTKLTNLHITDGNLNSAMLSNIALPDGLLKLYLIDCKIENGGVQALLSHLPASVSELNFNRTTLTAADKNLLDGAGFKNMDNHGANWEKK